MNKMARQSSIIMQDNKKIKIILLFSNMQLKKYRFTQNNIKAIKYLKMIPKLSFTFNKL